MECITSDERRKILLRFPLTNNGIGIGIIDTVIEEALPVPLHGFHKVEDLKEFFFEEFRLLGDHIVVHTDREHDFSPVVDLIIANSSSGCMPSARRCWPPQSAESARSAWNSLVSEKDPSRASMAAADRPRRVCPRKCCVAKRAD